MNIPLIGEIADWDNLMMAYKKARKGKTRRHEVAEFHAKLFENIAALQCELITGEYRMGEYRSFVVFEPKRREILAAPFRDRVVQHAILNQLESLWNKQMIDDTFACRKGKGTHAGADRIQRWLRDMSSSMPLNDVWVVKTDYSKYFASLLHSELKRIIRRKIECAGTLALLDGIIDSTSGNVGIPVGNLTSQWLANLYGNEIDQYVKRDLRVKRYLRYMDDIVAIFHSRSAAMQYLSRLEAASVSMGLKFSHSSVQRASFGVNMLGYRIWPTHRLLRKRSIVKMRRDIKGIRRKILTGQASAFRLQYRLSAWVALAKWADAHRLTERIKSEVGID